MTGFILWILESSLFVLMILGIRRVFQGKVPYAVIYVLWLAVLVRFLVPVNFIPSPFGIGDRVRLVASELKMVESSNASGYLKKHFQGKQEASEGKQSKKTSGKAVSMAGKNELPGTAAESRNPSVVLKKQKIYADILQWMKRIPWVTVFAMIWAAGSLGLFGSFLCVNFHFQRHLSRHRCLWGYKGNIAVYTTDVLHTPCLYGLLQPVIYLPEELLPGKGQITGISRDELDEMILHEYVHYIHKDHIWSMFRMLVTAAYWFDPFVWIAADRSKKDAELFCDETVLKLLGEEKRFQYGNLLIRIAGEQRRGEFCYSLMSMSRKGRELEKRVRAVSRPNKYSKWVILPLLLIVTAAVLLTCSSSMKSSAALEDKGNTENKITITVSSKDTAEELEHNRSDAPKQQEPAVSGKESTSEADQKRCRKLFKGYVLLFTRAVNSGKTEQLKNVILDTSAMYKQQSDMAKNYYGRGIREKIKSLEAVSIKTARAGAVQIDSKEEIKVSYADRSSKIVKQSYRYTCRKSKDKWLIVSMQNIE